ncbi:MAG: PAS domain S-box protein [Pseudomonadota bacterium]
MKIRTHINIIVTGSILTLILVLIALVFYFLESNRVKVQTLAVIALNQSLTQLRYVTVESIIQPSKRAQEQWQRKYQGIGFILNQYPFSDKKNIALLNNIRSNYNVLDNLYQRLIENVKTDSGSASERDRQQERLSRTVTSLLAATQDILNDVGNIARLNQNDAVTIQLAGQILTVSVVVVTGIVVGWFTLLIRKRVLIPIAFVQRGTVTVSSGQLDYRLDMPAVDEIGLFATAFDSMTARLQESYRQLTESEAFQRSVFEQAPDAIILVARSGNIVRANFEAEEMFGCSRAALAMLTVENLMPLDIRNQHTTLRETFFTAPLRRAMGSGRHLVAQRTNGAVFPVDVMLSPLHRPSGNLVIATIRDVTARERNDQALRASEQRFRAILEHAPIGMGLLTLDARWVEVNRALCEITGYDKTELQALTSEQIIHPDDLSIDQASTKQLLDGDIPSYQLEKRYIRKDGKPVPIMLTQSLLRGDDGNPINIIAQIENITARKEAQEQLRTLNNRLALATQAGAIGVWELDLGSKTLWWDQRMYELYRIEPSAENESNEKWRERVHPSHLERTERELEAAIKGNGIFNAEFPIVWPDGQVRTIRSQAVLSRDRTGQPLTMTGVNWDVTDEKRQKEAIQAALMEKEILLKELYHRVKNNLQVISSLLNLQARTLPDGLARVALKEGSNRVRAMALVHEKLYQSGNLSSIALNEYIAELCKQLASTAMAEERGITVIADVAPIQASLDTAIPLGLLLNELVSNSLKHAFPHGRCGHVTVRLELRADNTTELSIVDDGVGFPPDYDPMSSRSLGLKLVAALSAQIDGKLSLETREGARTTLIFQLGKLVDESKMLEHRSTTA